MSKWSESPFVRKCWVCLSTVKFTCLLKRSMRTECQCWSSRRLPKVTEVWLLLKCRLESPGVAQRGRRHQSYLLTLDWSTETQGKHGAEFRNASQSSWKHILFKDWLRSLGSLIHIHVWIPHTCVVGWCVYHPTTHIFPCEILVMNQQVLQVLHSHTTAGRALLLFLYPWFCQAFLVLVA